MREIKFRAWHDGKMMMVRSLHNTHSQVNIRAELCDPDGGFGTGKPAVTSEIIVDNLMQYTGLLDRRGVEIYEGDLVARYYLYPRTDLPRNPKVVKWVTKSKVSVGFNIAPDSAGTGNHLEVIGNIYQHSHLLEEK